MTILIIMACVGGLVSGLALLIRSYGMTKRHEGQLEEQTLQRAKESEAKDRANAVIVEQRDPDDAIKRLRDHNF